MLSVKEHDEYYQLLLNKSRCWLAIKPEKPWNLFGQDIAKITKLILIKILRTVSEELGDVIPLDVKVHRSVAFPRLQSDPHPPSLAWL